MNILILIHLMYYRWGRGVEAGCAGAVTNDGDNQPHRYVGPFPLPFIPSFSPTVASMYFPQIFQKRTRGDGTK
jgi:hypothetical protein